MNYQSGLAKKNSMMENNKGEDFRLTTSLAPLFLWNLGNINNYMPYSFGGNLIADINSSVHETSSQHPGLRIDMAYIWSESESRGISGFSLTFGPAWNIHTSVMNYGFDINISPLIGWGNYKIKDIDEQNRQFSFNMNFIAGLSLPFYRVDIQPLFRFSTIYDGSDSLLSIGFSLGAGYRFF